MAKQTRTDDRNPALTSLDYLLILLEPEAFFSQDRPALAQTLWALDVDACYCWLQVNVGSAVATDFRAKLDAMVTRQEHWRTVAGIVDDRTYAHPFVSAERDGNLRDESKAIYAMVDAVWKYLYALRQFVGARVVGEPPKPKSEEPADFGTGEWSRVMPLTDIADRVLKDPAKTRKLKAVYGHRLVQIGGKGSKNWQIRLDGLAANIRRELDRP
ncbi:MAG TPA: hypothetical protein VLI39_14305 [Sedimentisphaerales bacterium]|nr:hypothetical protein [Sedimentisphaerales bacterium]